jgi:hypothetical protein
MPTLPEQNKALVLEVVRASLIRKLRSQNISQVPLNNS